ncbi:TetR/AcrR family transcriptional regulator [Sporohalobacter salinus]|uniref:TetR/AcrR family transcriptional regulator n=1 Tax=Sporohalobacter salinus TaxID=1494606 RepID=UPI00196068D0|nr:TetR/AcrR family transcriptional regulator [Sporohalobacter salinus]MBM7624460.1 AcrR family transcriptional regulator [Sporohalobacter salinus]
MIDVEETNIKTKYILKIFIESTTKIIKKEGIKGVTIRKVADIAGYNSATIYNYFENCNQLISFAAMKFISNYIQALPNYFKQENSALENFLAVWECFCEYCFKDPQIYYAVFTEDIGDQSENLIKNYYSLFPEDLGDPPEEVMPMLMESNFVERCRISIDPCIKKGYFSEEEAEEINEMIRLTYQGMLSLLVNNRVDYSSQEAAERTMKYIRKIVHSYQ